jgi:Predicted membrane protein (DUF2207)
MTYLLLIVTLLFVLAFFGILLLLRKPVGREVLVPSYEPPSNVSPGVAAWLLNPGDLSRAMAAALANMAAKGYIKIEESDETLSVTQLATQCDQPLEDEEVDLMKFLFFDDDCFDFDGTLKLYEIARVLRLALENAQSSKSRAALSQVADYQKFLSEVDADAISRMSSAEQPGEMSRKKAFEIAFNLDKGWGQHFVDSMGLVATDSVTPGDSTDDNGPFARAPL